MRRVLMLLLFLAHIAAAQSSVRWRSSSGSGRPFETSQNKTNRKSPSRRHVVVEFAAPPSKAELEQLELRGISLVSALSDRAVVVSAPDWFIADSPNIAWSGAFSAADKISPQLRGRKPRLPNYIIEFHPDVDMGDARTIAVQCGLRIVDNPDLVANDLLVQGSAADVAALTSWDEVAYVYPASADLTRGIRVNACAGALTSAGAVSVGVPTVGDGWDGPGRNAASLNYAFAALSSKLPPDITKTEIIRAFEEWAKIAKLSFSASELPSGPKTLTVLFATGAHGDGYPFSGPGGSLAHTFFPFPVNPEPIAGDLHFDDSENWGAGSATDLFSVALHETGHALGLGHSDNPADVMYPYYRRFSGLAAGDIAAVLELYAAQNDAPADPPASPALAVTIATTPSSVNAVTITLTGTVSGGEGDVQVTWHNDVASGVAQGGRLWSAAIPLSLGANAIAITARDTQQHSVSTIETITRQQPAAATTIQITQPSTSGSYTSSSNSIILSGVAADPSGIDHVSWMNSRGGAGIASGGASWNSGPVGLSAGQNLITATAYAISGASASQSVIVSYAPPSMPPSTTPPATDTTAPALTIMSPGGTNVSTSAVTITFTGTASDNVGLTAVTWTSTTAGSGACIGTTNWRSPAIPLLVGTNVITIKAVDAAGNAGWRSVMVTRF